MKMSPAVTKCGLYGVKTIDEYWESACQKFFAMSDGKQLSGTIEKVWDGVNKVVLCTSDGKCINEKLISEAVARLTKKEGKPSGLGINYDDWKKGEQLARHKHIGIWRYGDVGSDDDDF